MLNHLSRRQTGTLCLVLIAGILAASWWPFAPFPPNRVHWLEDQPGLSFEPPGVAYDEATLPSAHPKNGANPVPELTIEVWLQPGIEPKTDVFHFLTIHDRRLPSNLVLCQWKQNVLLRSPGPGYPHGLREESIGAMQKGHRRFLTIVSDQSGIDFYADGELKRQSPELALPAESLRGRLILGDAANGKHGWTGNLFGVAIFNRALNPAQVAAHYAVWTNQAAASLATEPGLLALYLFNEGAGQWARDQSPYRHRLSLPSRYHVVQRVFLQWSWNFGSGDRYDWKDIVLNLIGFVPFGILVFRLRQISHAESAWLSGCLATVAGAGISFLIELGQVWLPTRVSSGLDLTCNTLGTLAGVLIAVLILKRGKAGNAS